MDSDLVAWDGLKFDVGSVSDAVKGRVRRNRYEGQTIDRVKAFCPTDIPFINFGGGMGIVDCLHNVRMERSREHVSVEGNPEACEISAANKDRNGCHYTIVNRALAYSKTVDFFIPDRKNELIMAGSVDSRFADQGIAGRTVTVPATSLQSIVDEFGFETFALCVDVEGAEYELIEREHRLIAERCKWLIVEWHFSNRQDDSDRIRSLKCKRLLKDEMAFDNAHSSSRMSVFTSKPRPSIASRVMGALPLVHTTGSLRQLGLRRRIGAAMKGFAEPDAVTSVKEVRSELNAVAKARPKSNTRGVDLKAVDADYKKHPSRADRVASFIKKAIAASDLPHGRALEIGGRENPRGKVLSQFEYVALDLADTGPGVLVGDITNCPHIEDNSFEFILSVDVFEHINAPWRAAKEIARILKPGGTTYHTTLFSWRYHPCPIDYWRYTPDALAFIFSDLECVEASFDSAERRRNITGAGHANPIKPDAIGGWRENWRVHYIGKKKAGQ